MTNARDNGKMITSMDFKPICINSIKHSFVMIDGAINSDKIENRDIKPPCEGFNVTQKTHKAALICDQSYKASTIFSESRVVLTRKLHYSMLVIYNHRGFERLVIVIIYSMNIR